MFSDVQLFCFFLVLSFPSLHNWTPPRQKAAPSSKQKLNFPESHPEELEHRSDFFLMKYVKIPLGCLFYLHTYRRAFPPVGAANSTNSTNSWLEMTRRPTVHTHLGWYPWAVWRNYLWSTYIISGIINTPERTCRSHAHTEGYFIETCPSLAF